MNMERILERYERYSYSEKQLLANDHESTGSWTLEHAKLKARVESFYGEDLQSLSLKELQNLEQQLDSALKHIRSRKNQVMYESISELQKKDKALQEQNNLLAKKVKEKEKALAPQAESWEQQVQNQGLDCSSTLLPEALQSLNFGSGSNYQGIRNDGSGGDHEDENETPTASRPNTLLPPWMLRHLNE
ncbi:AGAMOUS-like 8 [Prunus dulcis]|uniref:AGAMOUS-like 8 n=1 Tax=Prunus dulcis TaxID=3755 RepID=A0A4Y1RJH0_PRUDU|nr:AGAMOUS-like 8 [Prunus dulcis]